MSLGAKAIGTSQTLLKPVALDGDQYASWSFMTMNLLQLHGVADCVVPPEGKTQVSPGPDEDKLSWERRQHEAFIFILRSIPQSLWTLGRDYTTAAALWQRLKELYMPTSTARRVFLHQRFLALQYVSGDSMQTHIRKVNESAAELQMAGVNVSDQEKIVILLKSLPAAYGPTKEAFLVIPDGTFANLEAALLTKELALLQEAPGQAAPKMLFGKANDKKKGKCHYCSRSGHWKRDCMKRKADLKKAAPSGAQSHLTIANTPTEGLMFMHALSARLNSAIGQDDVWYIDSGATHHITGTSDLLEEKVKLEPAMKVFLGDNTYLEATHVGKTKFRMENGMAGVISEVLYVPKAICNILSISKLARSNLAMTFNADELIITAGKEQVAVVPRIENLYPITLLPSARANLSQVSGSLWHKRLGHLGQTGLSKLPSMVKGITSAPQVDTQACKGCLLGKHTHQPYPSSESRASRALELVHSDVCGPMATETPSGYKYFVTFTDDFSRKCWVYFMRLKSETFAKFLIFKALAENDCGSKIKKFRSDNGGEYTSTEFLTYLQTHGIQAQHTVPYNPQQNGVAERLNRTLMESARSMIKDKGLPDDFWAQAVHTAAYIRNRVPIIALKDMTAEQAWSGHKPDISNFRVFGSKAYAHVPDQTRSKLDDKSTECIFIGYPEDRKAYQLLEVASGKVITSRDVTFVEEEDSYDPDPDSDEEQVTLAPAVGKAQPDVQIQQFPRDDLALPMTKMTRRSSRLQRSARSASNTTQGEVAIPPGTVSGLDTLTGRESDDDDLNVLSGRLGRHQIRVNLTILEPTSYNEVESNPNAKQWEEAMDREYASLLENNTWQRAELPSGRKAIGCKWVFKVKYDKDGLVEKFKARLVAKGFSQKEGIDYKDTFAPVAKMTTIRFVMAIAAHFDMEIHQLDAVTAFLNGDLHEEIYMEQPEGYDDGSGRCLRLIKSLYGLKQSGREWYNKIHMLLIDTGFTRSKSDYSFYSGTDGKSFILLYVDDILLFATDLSLINSLKAKLMAGFKMTDAGEAHYCIGLEITRDRAAKTITLSQKKYATSILERFGMNDSRGITTPMEVGFRPQKAQRPNHNPELRAQYQEALGSLMYLMTGTRPDLAYSVGVLSKHMSNPTEQHWTAIKRVFRYVQHTTDFGLTFDGKTELRLEGYSDADYGGCIDTSKSTSGYAFTLGSACISWRSKQQSVVAQSTTEAEYIALTECAKEATWLHQVMVSGGIEVALPIQLLGDNQSSIALAKDPKYHGKTKHIRLKYHYIRECIELLFIILSYISTHDMIADIFTKPLSRDKFEKCRTALGLSSLQEVGNGKIETNT